jgi:predicted RNase H-like HicB family nuclease
MSRDGRRSGSLVAAEGCYYARVTKQRGGGYLVEFPDLRGCLTEGATLRNALANAREALSGWLFVAMRHGDSIPRGRVRRGRAYHQIHPDLDVMLPLVLRRGRERRGLTPRQVAMALGISEEAYRKFEVPGRSNPTLRALGRLSEILGLEFQPRAA